MRLIATQTSLIVAGLFIFILAPIALAQPAAADGAEQPLIPCLAVAADGSPVMPGRSLPSSKKLTVAFHLPMDDASKQLKSKWIALDADNQVVAENTLDLKGQKSGWLRLVLKQPAPAGKYRLETMLDDKPWESIDLEVVAPPEEGRAEKPADLIPLDEGKTLNYEMIMRPQPGTKIDMPNSTREPDGTIRSQVSVTFGKPNEVGTQKEISVNGKLAAILWVKVDEQGLRSYRKKEGEKVQDINPPWMIYPLPPKLEPGIEWTAKTNDGGEQKLTLFGPMTIDGPGGAATGYMIFAEEDTAHGSPGTEAVRGRDTYERYFVPKVGTDVRRALDEVANDDSVKAVVLRVDSPGGSATGSEIILEATKRVKARKPFVVSMGNVAGSGGYYVACGSDTIFADESTITGSIGVVAGKFYTNPMWNKVGITFKPYKRGKNAGILATGETWTPEQKQKMQSWMDEIYDVFKNHVTTIRGDRLKKPIDELAGGRVYTGKQALELGLVDKLGTLSDAVDHVAKQAKLEDGAYDVRVHPKPKNFVEELIAELTGGAEDENDSKYLSVARSAQLSQGALVDAALPYLNQLDPARVGIIVRALRNLEIMQDEGCVLAMPEIVFGR
jgi:signal peptide peptidase SppA